LALTLQRKRQLLQKALGRPAFEKPARSELVFHCGVCRHYKPKLSVNIETDWYNCWTCEPPRKGRTLTGLLRGKVSQEELSEYLDSLANAPRKRTPVVEDPTPVELPDGFRSMSHGRTDVTVGPFFSYVERRGVTPADIDMFRIGLCQTGQYRGRVVFPSFDSQGHLNYFTGRKVFADQWGQNYMMCSGSKDIIFNECLVDWDRPVTIVEGPFDMVAAGQNAIPLQGKMLRTGTRLFERLALRRGTVYLALDNDALDDQLAIAHTLFRYGVDARLVGLDGHKDVGEMGAVGFQRALAAARPYDVMDRVRLRA
jgi:hypothetical protein